MRKMSLLLVVILLLNILSFNVFAGDVEHLKWFYSIDDVVYEPKGSGVIKINDSIMVSINEFCGLLGYVISEENGKVTITEGKPCINNEGKIKQIDFEVGKNIIKLTEKSGKIQHLESLTDVSITYGYENEIYVSADDLQRIFDLKFDRSSYDKNEIIVYTQNYLSGIANNIKTFDELTNLSQKNIAEISIRKQADEVIITSPLIISDIADTVKNLQLRQNYDSGAGGWLYWVKFKTDTGEIIEYTVSTGEKIDGIQYRAIDDTEVRNCLEHYYNLYKSINSSEWATDIIAEAVNLGIINEDNSWNFPSSICREDFCNIAVRMIESAGIILPTENPQRPLGIKDTNNINVLKLYKAGVILGKEQHKTGITFAPGDFITREEAATILGRIATYFKISAKENIPYANYSDSSSISDWARVAVSTMYQLGVMTGVSETEFSPKGLYTVEQTVATMVRLYNVIDKSKALDIMQPLGCDDYNGQVFIDSYPKAWQGFDSKPIASSNGYFNILPGKLLYSYDRENWNLLYEDVDGERVYHNLPDDVDIGGARYAWEYNCFVNAPFDVNKSYYSYDNKEWIKGKPESKETVSSVDSTIADILPYGIPKESVIYDSESGLYLAWQPYEENDYFSERYQTTLTEVKCDTIWASVDAKEWAKITIPEEVLFFTSAGINTQAKALIIDAAIEFTDEEKAFLDEEEIKAKKLKQGYDKPKYKIEKYIVMLSNLRDILCAESSVEQCFFAEHMSLSDVQELQNLVNEGHMSWRTDVALVVKAFIANKTKKDAENGKIVELAGGSERCSVKFELDGTTYNLELVRPIDKTDNGVWVVETFVNEANKEIFFYEPSIEKTPVEKQDDGWYKFPEKVVALFPFPSFDYEKPISVTAIFTPTGTEMDIMAKEIAKIEPPYLYHSMAEVLNMEISLPSDATRGHLFFRFEFEDGSVMDSQDFKVYQN